MKFFTLSIVIVSLLFISGLNTASARQTTSTACCDTQAEKNIAPSCLISYPKALKEKQKSGVVVVSYKVNSRGRIETVKVHTQNQELNEEIAASLLGHRTHRFSAVKAETDQEHILKIHFILS